MFGTKPYYNSNGHIQVLHTVQKPNPFFSFEIGDSFISMHNTNLTLVYFVA